MKKQLPRISILKYCALLAALACGLALHAQTTYQWNNTAGGSWASTANWNGGIVASGSGNTADFSELTLTAAPTVTLDGAQTIGNLLFGDQGNTYGWSLTTGSGDPLTLAVSSGSPTVTVNGQTTTVGCVLAGTQGLALAGAGTLTLTAANTYTGNTVINGGKLNGVAGAFGFGNISLNASSTTLGITSGTVTNTLNAASGVTGTLNLSSGLTFAGLFSGSGTVKFPAGSFSYTYTFTSTADSAFSGALVSQRGASVFSGANANFSGTDFQILPSSTGDTATYLEFTGSGTTAIKSVSSTCGGQIEIGPSTILNAASGTINQGTTSSQNTIIEPSSGTTSALTSSSGTLTFGGTSGTIQINAGVALTNYSVGTPLAVVQNGTETLALEDTSTYTGGTTINNGTLSLGNGGGENVLSLGTGSVTVNSGAFLKFIPGSSGSTFNFTNAIVLNGGTVWGDDGYQLLTGPMSVTANGGILESRWNNKYLYAYGPITGSGPLTLAYASGGSPVQIHLTNNLSGYTGLVTINTGAELVMDANMTLNGLAGAGAVVNNGHGLNFNNSVTANLSGVISGTGSVTNTGTGQTLSGVTLVLLATNSFNGTVVVNAGLVEVLGANTNATGGATVSGGTMINGGRLLATAGGWYTARSISTGMLTVNTNGTAEFTLAHGFGGDNYGRAVTINGGTLQFDAENYVSGLTLSGGSIAGTGEFRSVAATYVVNPSAIPSVISVPVSLYSSCTFDVGSGASLLISGNVYNSGGLTKTDSGALVLTGTNTYTGGTTVSNGTLEVDGSLGIGGVTVAGGTLDGSGNIGSSVTVNSGATLACGSANIGELTISGPLLLSGTTTVRLNKTGSVLTNDSVQGLSSVTYGGTLTVTATGTALAAGDTFTLFGSSSYSGSFSATNLPALASGLAWITTYLAVNGSIQVVATVNTTPGEITASVSGSVLSLSWPADHTGWRLLVQTNHLAAGLSSNPSDWTTVAGSAGIDQTNIPINPAQPAAFYRLVYP